MDIICAQGQRPWRIGLGCSRAQQRSFEQQNDESVMKKLRHLTELRLLLDDMERQLGLETLSQLERDILYVAVKLADPKGYVIVADLMGHELIAYASRPTFYRAFSLLQRKGYFTHPEEAKRGEYVLRAVGKLAGG
jgi:hypothetical protein